MTASARKAQAVPVISEKPLAHRERGWVSEEATGCSSCIGEGSLSYCHVVDQQGGVRPITLPQEADIVRFKKGASDLIVSAASCASTTWSGQDGPNTQKVH